MNLRLRAALFVTLAACSPTNQGVILRELNARLATQYHECVPLGWNPKPVVEAYFVPRYSAEFHDASWIAPLWLASIPDAIASRPDARAAALVMNDLVAIGMLARHHVGASTRYRLTMRGRPYYFDRNEFGDNPDHLPYLCYSRIVPQQILWNQPVHLERFREESQRVQIFRASFTWIAGARDAWAADPVLRSHTGVLPPSISPAIAEFANLDGSWEVVKMVAAAPPLPRVSNVAVWPK